jgi:hypothetical protein
LIREGFKLFVCSYFGGKKHHPGFCEFGKARHLGPSLDCLKEVTILQGEGVLYEEENLNQVFGQKADQFNFDKFKYMCIMSGIR